MESLGKQTNDVLQKDALIPELTNYLGLQKFADIAHLPKNEKANLWKNAATEMQPHIQGTMPTTINKSFPYEGSDILAYRKNVYNSTTAPLLQKAITGVKARVLEAITYEADERVLEYLNTQSFEKGLKFDDYMREFYYAMRVKDPNAILAIQQMPTEDRTQTPILKLVIHSSADIVYQCNDFLITKAQSEKKDVLAYYFYGKNTQALIYVESNKEAYVVKFQSNDNDFLPTFFLGGRTKSESFSDDMRAEGLPNIQPKGAIKELYYYASDFSYALPLMNKCETLSSQSNISSLKAAIPITVQREMTCGTCKGEGFIFEQDEYGQILFLPDTQTPKRRICPTCNGAKVITPLKTNEVIIPHSVDAFGADKAAGISDISKNLVGYVSPSVENAKFISEETEKAEKKVQDALNLDYTNLNFAVSAESKKQARTEKETFLKEVAGSVKRVYEHILKAFTLFLSYKNDLRADMLAKIKVILPTQFITIGVDEIEKTYLENKTNLTLQQRDATQRQIQKNQNPSQTDKIDLYFDMAWESTNGLWLATAVELNEINLLGSLTNEDKVRAIKAANYIYKLVFMKGLMDSSQILSQTDTYIKAELAKIQPLNLPSLDSTDSIEP